MVIRLTQYLSRALELRELGEQQTETERQLTLLFHNKPF
jgi:hypothetical protein